MDSQHRRWFEYGPIAAVGILAGLVWAFFGLVDEVLEGDTRAFDQAVVLVFREPGDAAELIGPRWFEEMARDVTALGSFAALAILFVLVVGYLLLTRKRHAAALMAISVLGGTAISTLLKFGFDRPRPDLASNAHVFTASFPSGHAMLSAVTFLTIGALLARQAEPRRLKLFFILAAIVLTLLVGASRVYLGVHYPTDVLAGWSIGAAWAMLCTLVALYLQRRGEVEPPSP